MWSRKGRLRFWMRRKRVRCLTTPDISTLIGLRDRALIGLMCYSFARISAAIGMNVEDYYHQGKRSWFRLHEKGGKLHEVPAHHRAEQYLDAYIAAAGIGKQVAAMPQRHREITDASKNRMTSVDV